LLVKYPDESLEAEKEDLELEMFNLKKSIRKPVKEGLKPKKNLYWEKWLKNSKNGFFEELAEQYYYGDEYTDELDEMIEDLPANSLEELEHWCDTNLEQYNDFIEYIKEIKGVNESLEEGLKPLSSNFYIKKWQKKDNTIEEDEDYFASAFENWIEGKDVTSKKMIDDLPLEKYNELLDWAEGNDLNDFFQDTIDYAGDTREESLDEGLKPLRNNYIDKWNKKEQLYMETNADYFETIYRNYFVGDRDISRKMIDDLPSESYNDLLYWADENNAPYFSLFILDYIGDTKNDIFIESLLEMKGGKGEHTDPSTLDPDQLRLGIAVEMEHTDDSDISSEIAIDHLTEDPAYYTTLLKSGLVDEPQALKIWNEIKK
jgi:hypothetical protein